MRILIYAGILILSCALQTTVLAGIQLWGLQIDLLLPLVISIALINGWFTGGWFGLFGGLILDVTVGKYLGLYALCYMLVGVIAGLFAQRRVAYGVLLPAAMAVGGSLVKECMLLVIIRILGVRVGALHMLIRVVLPGALLCGVWMLGIHPLMRLLHRWRWMTKQVDLD